jgi:isopentenyl-diphosphate delta-isomerase
MIPVRPSRLLVFPCLALLLALNDHGCSGFVPTINKNKNTISGRPSQSFPRYATTKYGENMDQKDMMESDMLVLVDEHDVLVETPESTSKKIAHTFNEQQPRGICHRAFSFFLFNEENKMLLTQRASSKITFPGVWTNTCCSHPLYGMTPNEVDQVPAAYPDFPGIKHAAIRKCGHELGIDPKYLPHDQIQFISRFHYWASDTITYGENAPWGEHGTL